jgi:hypothetical protein
MACDGRASATLGVRLDVVEGGQDDVEPAPCGQLVQPPTRQRDRGPLGAQVAAPQERRP